MLIRGSSAQIPRIKPPISESVQPPASCDVQDTLCFESGQFSPLGVGNFSGEGLAGKVMKWTSREIPSNQAPISDEETQQILDKLEPGDIILTYASHRPNLGHLEYWTTGAHYTHCALYEGYGRIIETLGDEVTRSPLVDRMDGPIKIGVVRPPYKNLRDRGRVIREAKKLVGTPYDYNFDNDDQKELYCSEFIEVAMKKVDPELDVPDASLFGWEITAPDAFKDMKGAKLIHDGKSNYWKNQVHQLPLWLGSTAGAGIGAAAGATLGAAIGGGLGGAIMGGVGGLLGAFAGYEGTLAATKYFGD